MIVQAGTADVTTYFELTNSSDGSEATGLTVTALDLSYVRDGDAVAAKVDASDLGSANAAHSANGAYEVDSTDAPGLYRIDWPDAAFAAGVGRVQLIVKHADIRLAVMNVDLSITNAKLLAYLQLLAREDDAIATDNSTELTELNADGGSGAGAYDNKTDALENLSPSGTTNITHETQVQRVT